LARELIEAVRPALAELGRLRAQAYIVLAWGHLLTKGVKDAETLEPLAFAAAKRLVECYHRSSRHDWQWFETRLTYANAVLPHALFMAAKRWPGEEFLHVAKASFEFLDRTTTSEGIYWPIGNSDWYRQGEVKALYDQQPVEAVTMAEAALAAFGLEHEDGYLSTFCRTNDWFHGHNSLAAALADPESGACCDGLQPLGVNRNQGAESTLAYLWMAVHNFEVQIELGRAYAPLVTDAQPQASLLQK
jgi:hypothetical protein